MEIKGLVLDLGAIALKERADPPAYSPGWYYDAAGNRYYYDGRQWYVYAAGLLYPLAAYMNPAPKQVTLAIGDKLKITMSFKYSGPAISSAVCYYSIGVYGALGFDEKLVGQNSKNIPQYTTPTEVTDSYTFTIPSNVGADWDDIYCKIYGGSPSVPQNLFGYENALIYVGLTPTITDFKILDFVKV